MRAFIAVDLPENIRESLVQVEKQLDSDAAKIKWVEKDNLHLTVKFLGEISDEQAEKIKHALSKIKFEQQTVSISETGVFPSEDYIKVIWVGIRPNEQIIELHKNIESALTGLGIKKDTRKFEAHITLGRVRFVKDKPRLVKSIKSADVKTDEFTISSFKLKKSTLTEKGPIYEDIKKIRL